MDVLQLQGKIDAIFAESRLPSPSHNNLARLIAEALTLIKNDQYVAPEKKEETKEESVETIPSQSDVQPDKLKKSKRSKK